MSPCLRIPTVSTLYHRVDIGEMDDRQETNKATSDTIRLFSGSALESRLLFSCYCRVPPAPLALRGPVGNTTEDLST